MPTMWLFAGNEHTHTPCLTAFTIVFFFLFIWVNFVRQPNKERKLYSVCIGWQKKSVERCFMSAKNYMFVVHVVGSVAQKRHNLLRAGGRFIWKFEKLMKSKWIATNGHVYVPRSQFLFVCFILYRLIFGVIYLIHFDSTQKKHFVFSSVALTGRHDVWDGINGHRHQTNSQRVA